jgi:hypothetical protein
MVDLGGTLNAADVLDKRYTYYCDTPDYPRKDRPGQWSKVGEKNSTMYGSYPVFDFIPGTRFEEEPTRFGDFKSDLDTGEIACANAIEIIGWFQQVYGVESEQWCIFLSGKKGVHLELASSILGTEDGHICLPIAYKTLAADIQKALGVTLDLSLYCMKTGRPFRKPNVMRDTGTCKRQKPFLAN